MTVERAGRIAGVVLAAGASSRLGARKLLLLIRFRAAGSPGATPGRRALAVIVVLGHEAEQVASALAGLAVETGHQLGVSCRNARLHADGIEHVPRLPPRRSCCWVYAARDRGHDSRAGRAVSSGSGAARLSRTMARRRRLRPCMRDRPVPALAGAGTGGGREGRPRPSERRRRALLARGTAGGCSTVRKTRRASACDRRGPRPEARLALRRTARHFASAAAAYIRRDMSPRRVLARPRPPRGAPRRRRCSFRATSRPALPAGSRAWPRRSRPGRCGARWRWATGVAFAIAGGRTVVPMAALGCCC